MIMSLNVTSELTSPTVAEIKLDGKLVDETVADFEAAFSEIVTADVLSLVLDMKGLSFISSAGIGSIIKLKTRLNRDGKHLAMVYMQPQVERVFEITHLTPLLHTFVSKEQLDDYLAAVQKEITGG
jgi:anti-anti-sigma factor